MRYAGMLTADEGAGHRDHVPGTFAQAAGEVREPVRPVRDVLRDPVALADDLGLERVRTPCSIANSNGVGCSFANARARSIIRPSWLATAKSRAWVNSVPRCSAYARSTSARLRYAPSAATL